MSGLNGYEQPSKTIARILKDSFLSATIDVSNPGTLDTLKHMEG